LNGSNQTTVATTALGGALGTILVTVASVAGVDLDQTQAVALAGAVVVLVTAVVGYFTKPKTSG